MIRQFFWAVCW